MKRYTTFSTKEVIVIVLAFTVIFSQLTWFFATNTNLINHLSTNEEDIINAYQDIIDDYYEKVDETELKEAAVNGMMDLLDEKYSNYYDSEESNSLSDSLAGSYKGIGITIYKNSSNQFEILKVISGSSAETSGLKEGDIILTINGNVLTSETKLDSLSTYLEESDIVKLEISRDNAIKLYEINIGEVVIPVTTYEVLEGTNYNLGYISLSSFTASSSEQFEHALKSLEEENISGLIIDLRGNTGGYVSETVNIASLFLRHGKTILSLENKDSKDYIYDETDEYRKYPIVVLVNSLTASASEILSYALKESYGAYLVGTTTYGKGRAQQTDKLSDESIIKYTSALWYSPNGNSCDGEGIKPSIYVKLNSAYYENMTKENDNQLTTGIDLINNILKSRNS